MLTETKMKQNKSLQKLAKLQRDKWRDKKYIEMITFIRHVPLIVPVPAFHFEPVLIS